MTAAPTPRTKKKLPTSTTPGSSLVGSFSFTLIL